MLRQELGYLSSPFGVPFQGDDGFFAGFTHFIESKKRSAPHNAALCKFTATTRIAASVNGCYTASGYHFDLIWLDFL